MSSDHRNPWGSDVVDVANHPVRRVGHTVTTLVIVAVLALTLVDGADIADVFGVDDTTATLTVGATTLEVRYPTVSRPGLATPFGFTVERTDGSRGPVEVAITSSYLTSFDVNYVSPTPSAETSGGDWVIWTFDDVEGDVLDVRIDARLEPAVQSAIDGRVGLVDDGTVVDEVSFTTRVWP